MPGRASGHRSEGKKRASSVAHPSDYSLRGRNSVSREVRASADPVHARDVLDEAVRCLAVSTRPMLDRLSVAGDVLRAGLTWQDFVEREDRRLFENIVEDLGNLRDWDALSRVGSR
jgi:hypothetical protein